MTDMHDLDLAIKSIEPRMPAVETWANGGVSDRCRFEALVLDDHANCEEIRTRAMRHFETLGTGPHYQDHGRLQTSSSSLF